jgi:hypothetical protein
MISELYEEPIPAFRARARMVLKSRRIEEEPDLAYEEWLKGKK